MHRDQVTEVRVWINVTTAVCGTRDEIYGFD